MPGIIDKKYIPIEMTHDIRIKWGQQIIKTVCIFYNVKEDRLFGKCRTIDLVRACQVSSYLIKTKINNLTYQQISALFGKRYLCKNGHDHAAIIHNLNKVRDLVSIGDNIKQDIDQLLKLI